MTQILEATFDGEVFRPTESVALQPNTRVELIVTAKAKTTAQPKSYLNWLDQIAGKWQGEFERIPMADFEQRDSF